MIHNYGINDVKGDSTAGSKDYRIYIRWKHMIERCYSPRYQQLYPSYIGTTVHEDWKYYSNYKKWHLEHFVEGYELDKDIIAGNCKLYSPDTCSFVPKDVNYCILDGNGVNNIFPYGVWYVEKKNGHSYRSCISKYNKQKHIGYFPTVESAHRAWQEEKIIYLNEIIGKYTNIVSEDVIKGIQRRDDILQDDIHNNRITHSLSKI